MFYRVFVTKFDGSSDGSFLTSEEHLVNYMTRNFRNGYAVVGIETVSLSTYQEENSRPVENVTTVTEGERHGRGALRGLVLESGKPMCDVRPA